MTKTSSRGKGGKRLRDRQTAVSAWKEKENLRGNAVDAGVIILRTSGCRHFHDGGCSMCGYNLESDRAISGDDIVRQFGDAVSQMGDVAMLKVYTSGSFLDDAEVPREAASTILKECADRGIRLLVESRPEYINDESLDRLLADHRDVEVAIGLESANDRVLKYSINKGFGLADFETAASALKDKDIDLRTYILLKPPFLTEKEAVADAVATAKLAAPLSHSISINAVNVQKGTLVERLWKDWSYRPPWLWSVLEVARECAALGPTVLCDPVGGGSKRGAHNCGKCDDVILDGLKRYTVSQDRNALASPECECRSVWETVSELEGLVASGTPDLERFFMGRRA